MRRLAVAALPVCLALGAPVTSGPVASTFATALGQPQLSAQSATTALQSRPRANGVIQSDLRNAATEQEVVLTERGHYTRSTATLKRYGFTFSPRRYYHHRVRRLTIVARSDRSFCIDARSATGKRYRYATKRGLERGRCPCP